MSSINFHGQTLENVASINTMPFAVPGDPTSVAIGFETDTAYGWRSVAIGSNCSATATGQVAIGAYNTCEYSNGSWAIAIGYNNTTESGVYGRAIAIGYSNTGRSRSIIIGTYTDLGSGKDNIVMGYRNSHPNQNGTDNVCLGSRIMNHNAGASSASDNVVLGTSTARRVSSNRNTFIGKNHGTTSTDISGDDNIVIGYDCVNALSSGANNIVFGRVSGVTMTTGSDNILVGRLAETGSIGTNYGVAIGKSASTETDCVAIGKDAVSSGATSISIGVSTDATNTSAIALGNGSQATGLQAVAIGDVAIASATGSIAIGDAATVSGVSGVSIGVGVGGSVVGTSNVAIGSAAMQSSNNAGVTHNVCIGTDAGKVISGAAAHANVMVGYNAGNTSATGEKNVCIGANSDCGSGVDSCVSIGNNSNAASDMSIAMGVSANAAGSYSVAIGRSASATSNGVAIGRRAGDGNTTGSYNVCIGTDADVNTNTVGCVSIGHGARQINHTRNHSVCIGTAAESLQQGGVSIGENTYTGGSWSIAIGQNASINANNNYSICIGKNATITGGTSASSSRGRFVVWPGQSIRVGNGTNAVRYNTGNGEFTYQSSLRSHKEDIIDMPDMTHIIDQINAQEFTFKDNGERACGMIAEDLEPLYSLLCAYGVTNDGVSTLSGINYDTLTMVLWQEAQKQHKKNIDLEARIAVLESLLV